MVVRQSRSSRWWATRNVILSPGVASSQSDAQPRGWTEEQACLSAQRCHLGCAQTAAPIAQQVRRAQGQVGQCGVSTPILGSFRNTLRIHALARVRQRLPGSVMAIKWLAVLAKPVANLPGCTVLEADKVSLLPPDFVATMYRVCQEEGRMWCATAPGSVVSM
jgi:hypothetical protein